MKQYSLAGTGLEVGQLAARVGLPQADAVLVGGRQQPAVGAEVRRRAPRPPPASRRGCRTSPGGAYGTRRPRPRPRRRSSHASRRPAGGRPARIASWRPGARRQGLSRGRVPQPGRRPSWSPARSPCARSGADRAGVPLKHRGQRPAADIPDVNAAGRPNRRRRPAVVHRRSSQVAYADLRTPVRQNAAGFELEDRDPRRRVVAAVDGEPSALGIERQKFAARSPSGSRLTTRRSRRSQTPMPPRPRRKASGGHQGGTHSLHRLARLPSNSAPSQVPDLQQHRRRPW